MKQILAYSKVSASVLSFVLVFTTFNLNTSVLAENSKKTEATINKEISVRYIALPTYGSTYTLESQFNGSNKTTNMIKEFSTRLSSSLNQ